MFLLGRRRGLRLRRLLHPKGWAEDHLWGLTPHHKQRVLSAGPLRPGLAGVHSLQLRETRHLFSLLGDRPSLRPSFIPRRGDRARETSPFPRGLLPWRSECLLRSQNTVSEKQKAGRFLVHLSLSDTLKLKCIRKGAWTAEAPGNVSGPSLPTRYSCPGSRETPQSSPLLVNEWCVPLCPQGQWL